MQAIGEVRAEIIANIAAEAPVHGARVVTQESKVKVTFHEGNMPKGSLQGTLQAPVRQSSFVRSLRGRDQMRSSTCHAGGGWGGGGGWGDSRVK